MALKQVILVRSDLALPKGKMAAQVAHASLEAAMKSDKQLVSAWREEGGKKVVLKVDDDKQMLAFKELCARAGLKTALIIDAGHTVLAPGTMTCLGVGPDSEEKIDKVTGKLKMM